MKLIQIISQILVFIPSKIFIDNICNLKSLKLTFNFNRKNQLNFYACISHYTTPGASLGDDDNAVPKFVYHLHITAIKVINLKQMYNTANNLREVEEIIG